MPDQKILSPAHYNLTIGLVLIWGFIVNFLIIRFVSEIWLIHQNISWFIGGFIISCLIGMTLYRNSTRPLVSFIGYNFIAGAYGILLNPIINFYPLPLVLQAIALTAAFTVAMMILGFLFPAFFQAIHKVLFLSLLIVVGLELILMFVFHKPNTWTDWIVALIFCGYIGFDWGRANALDKTLDNAIDGAAAIYIDIINLFMRILRILAKQKSDSSARV